MYKKRKDEYGDVPQTFYRAGHVSKKQLKNMNKQQKGQVISLVGFISATTDIKIARGYARKQNISKDNETVLFQINIKPQEPCTAFAYIDGISFHPEEKEVLFSMGSTFTVDAVVKPENGENYHTIQLTAREIDKSLIDDIRTKIENCSPSGRAVLLAQYLMELGEYRAVRKYLNSLLTQVYDGGVLINDPSLAIIYSCLGMTYARQGLHGDAIKAFKQALNTQARLEYSNNNVLANIYNNIGLAYVGLSHMDEAEKTLEEAKRIQLRELNSNQQHLAEIYSNIGYVHYKKSNFIEAKEAFSEAEKIYKRSSSKIAHDALEQSLIKAEYLTNYGHLLSVYKSLDDAQERYNEALKLYKSILLDSNPKLMQAHINIMLAYAQNENYSKVTKWYEDLTKEKLIEKQEINMFKLNSSITQASLAFLHEFVGACYVMQKSFDKAIRLWVRALIFKHKARLEQLLIETTNSISSALIVEQKTLIKKCYRLARDYYTNPNEYVFFSDDFFKI
jgi:tetratricopeptide (TPR) repeat protein